MPREFGYPMSAGFGFPIHTSEDILFQKPSAAYEEAYREIADETEEEDPNKTDQPQDPTPLPESPRKLGP